MSTDNEKRSTKNKKKDDKEFHSKHIKHKPQDESARAVFGIGNKEDISK